MESLYELFEKTLPHKSYYDIEIIPHELFSYSESHANCKRFIDAHFNKGGKERVLDTEFRTFYEVSGKHEHTVALFLLGLLFRDVFCPEIRRNLTDLGLNDAAWYKDNDFMYWATDYI